MVVVLLGSAEQNRSIRGSLVDLASNGADPEVVAFYYPQFHQTPLNDRLYGTGFTEWDNVRRGIPLYEGHHQPRVPADELGYYSLDDPTVYDKQVALARDAGVAGFCFYHYWMTGGRRILERPFEAVLQSDNDFPFCLMWANHDWTMAWRGEPQTLSLEMTYATQDPADFIADVAGALQDERYIRIDGKPLLSIYEIDGPPNLSLLVEGLRSAARDQGIGELFIAGVQIRLDSPNRFCPDLDALCEFPPHGYYKTTTIKQPSHLPVDSAVKMHDYRAVAAQSLVGANLAPGRKYFRAAIPDWDNTARRIENLDPFIFDGSAPERFGLWLQGLLASATESDEILPIVFVNAWNEWGEGAYLEPDQTNGHAYLDALKRATLTWRDAPTRLAAAEQLVEHDPGRLAELRPVGVSEFEPAETPSPAAGATVWIDQFQFNRAPFDVSTTVMKGYGHLRGLVAHPTVTQLVDQVLEHTLYLCADDGDAYAVTLPSTARPDLVRDDGWLSADNVAAAGFEGWVDFRSVPPGSYELRIPAGDRLGIFKTRVEISATEAANHLPDFEIPKEPVVSRSLFQPGTEYSAKFRPGSAHDLVEQFVRASGARRVLDCGCADGSFGAQLISDDIEVHGLEYDLSALARAKSRLATANGADLELPNWTSKPPGTFDALLFIDVLEHVRRPDLVVHQARELLNPGGSIITSIPNVAHVSLRLELLAGRWDYQDWGLLDRTHLRFFTLTSIERLFREAGYELERVEHTLAPPGMIGEPPVEIPNELAALFADDEAQAYQYIVQARIIESG